MTLQSATRGSVNAAFARLIWELNEKKETGAEKVAETARRMGIASNIPAYPSIALGSENVSPYEMASAYGTLAAGGSHAEPRAITQVRTDREVLFESQAQVEQALDPAVAYLATHMLEGVIARGTGRAAALGRPAAGKTGTTQEYRDAWFVGYTPDLAASVWVGYPSEQLEMKNVHGRTVTGGSFPAEIWAAFMKNALADVPANDFERPDGLRSETICRDSGELATEWCEDTGSALFLSDAVPGDCSVHTGPVIVDLPNLIGKTKEEAIALLNQLKLLFKIREKPSDTVPEGIVSDQDPRGGSEVTTDTVITIVISTGAEPSEPPVARFSFMPLTPSSGQEVTFDASASSDDGSIVSYYWEFGDGADGEGDVLSHAFETAGTYEVTLWVTDDEGLAGSLTAEVIVQ
jgi:penicillin-binding protein 1A